MSDLTFNGGATGASMGNQQYTMRNLIFNNCQTGRFARILVDPGQQGLTCSSHYSTLGLGLDLHWSSDQQLWKGH
jgi:hypothetical protein